MGPEECRAGVHLVVEDLRLPDQLAALGVEGVDVVVVAGVDDQVAVDGHVPVVVGQAPHDLGDVLGDVAAVLPPQVAGHGVDGLHVVPRVRHEQHAAVGQRGPLLRALGQGSGPHELQVADVVAVHLVERAVAPAVLRAAPHEPVARRRVLEHGVGDGHETLIFDGLRRHEGRERHEGKHHKQESKTLSEHRTLPGSEVRRFKLWQRPCAAPVPCRGMTHDRARFHPVGSVPATVVTAGGTCPRLGSRRGSTLSDNAPGSAPDGRGTGSPVRQLSPA